MQRDGERPRRSLASLDFLGSDAQLRAQAEYALRESDDRRQLSVNSGQDPSGSVAVFVDEDGQVEEVTVGPAWRDQVGVRGFADALFEAYHAALRAVVEASAMRQLRQGFRTAPGATPDPVNTSADDLDEQLWLRRTWQTLQAIDADLRQLARRPACPAERDLTSPSGCLTLHLRGGSVVAITGDIRLIAALDAGRLRSEAQALFRAHALARSQPRS
ncbi:hypothetical protein [Micromonospora musae]|uniref:hypothetical protein n=1 Tax=Micromonospora musae TaxID=1894970 RepID=UPI003424EEDA